jgi:hypothetical protein
VLTGRGGGAIPRAAQDLRRRAVGPEQILRSRVMDSEENGPFSGWHVPCKEVMARRSGVNVRRCTADNNNRSIADNMTRMNQWLVAAGVAAVMSFGANQLSAQPDNAGPGGGGRPGRGNFDPAQMQQRMMERTKETLEVTDEAEWKAMQPLVQKVMDLRRQSFSGMGRGMFGRGPRGGDNPPGGDQAQQRRGGMFGTPSPEAEALQKAIDSKASKAEMKAALDKYQASRKASQAALEQAQADLRKVLTTRQEALATLNGLL